MVQIPAFETIAQAHGDTCPGIALGYKIVVVAVRWANDEDGIRIVSHTTRCPLGALKVTFDVRYHPAHMTVEDTGTVSFVITLPDGRRLFVNELSGTHLTTDELNVLKKKIEAGMATLADLTRIDEIKNELFRVMQKIPDNQLFTVHE